MINMSLIIPKEQADTKIIYTYVCVYRVYLHECPESVSLFKKEKISVNYLKSSPIIQNLYGIQLVYHL